MHKQQTCYDALHIAIHCVRSARSLRGLDMRAAANLLANAAEFLAYADQRRTQAPYSTSSIGRILRAVSEEVDYQEGVMSDHIAQLTTRHAAEA